jgi:NDP-sugar pyrophosphorylase family protein
MERELTESEAKIEKEMEVQRDAKMRADNCMVDVKNACHKWKCRISPIVLISGSAIMTNYEVVPLIPVEAKPQ